MKLNFYPKWYIEKLTKKSKKLCGYLIIALVIFIFFTIVFLYFDFLELTSMEKSISNKEEMYRNIDRDETSEANKSIIFEKYSQIIEEIDRNNLKLKSLNISEGTIELSLYIDSKYEYTKILEDLNDKYTIVGSSPIQNEGDKYYFTLKVKQDV